MSDAYYRPIPDLPGNRNAAKPSAAPAAGIIVATTPTVPGREIYVVLGIVSSQVAFGMNVFKDIATAWRDFVGGRTKSLQGILADSRKQVLAELAAEAMAIGADAVVGIDLDMSEFSVGGGMVMMIATGTAVRLAAPIAAVAAVSDYEATIRQSISAWGDQPPPAALVKVLASIDAERDAARRQAGIEAALAHVFEPLRKQIALIEVAFAEKAARLRYHTSVNDQKKYFDPLIVQFGELKQAAEAGRSMPEQWRALRDGIDAIGKPDHFADLIAIVDEAMKAAAQMQSEIGDLTK
jgi:uncharacterized protein YbjQ (UPF0145 family)